MSIDRNNNKNENVGIAIFMLPAIISAALYVVVESFLLTIIICVVLYIFTFLGYFVISTKLDDKKYERYIRKAKSDDKYIIDRLVHQKLQLSTSDNDSNLRSDLISAGAWLLCCDANSAPVLALTEHGGVMKGGFLHKDAVKPYVRESSEKGESYTYTTTAPKASATKRAVVGGLIGGPTGAVIGAVSANEANAKGATEETHTGYFHNYYYSLKINDKQFDNFCVAKKMYEYMDFPELKKFKVYEKDNYYLITGKFIRASYSEEDELKLICEKFEKVWFSMNS